MSSSKLAVLLKEGKINHMEYQTYMVFQANDIGRDYLRYMVESSFMEEPINQLEDGYAWHDGRRSIWRDIKIIINKLDKLMEAQHDG